MLVLYSLLGDESHESYPCLKWQGMPSAEEVRPRLKGHTVTGLLIIASLHMVVPAEQAPNFIGRFVHEAAISGGRRTSVRLEGSYDGTHARVHTTINPAKIRNEAVVEVYSCACKFFETMLGGSARKTVGAMLPPLPRRA